MVAAVMVAAARGSGDGGGCGGGGSGDGGGGGDGGGEVVKVAAVVVNTTARSGARGSPAAAAPPPPLEAESGPQHVPSADCFWRLRCPQVRFSPAPDFGLGGVHSDSFGKGAQVRNSPSPPNQWEGV